MSRRDLFVIFAILVGAIIIAALAPGPFVSDAQISNLPTWTFTPVPPPPTPTDTPIPPTPTDTSVPPTATDTAFPPTPTDTPFPPTNTPTPIPVPPQLSSIQIDLPQALVSVGTFLDFTVYFTDPEVSLALVTWDWGDATSSLCPPNSDDCMVDPGNGWQGTVIGSHAYSDPGVYTVELIAVDAYGQFDTATYEYAIAYDPAGGFVTGGGWIDSPPGAYKPDPTLVDKATFGFVSKYKKGSSRPTGNTVFQFKVGDLNFYSDTYYWLVVNQGGTNAQFKGEGTINGALDPNGNAYRFMLWAEDGTPDTFRMKIWWEDGSGEIVDYDNGFGQANGAGNITVYSPSKGN